MKPREEILAALRALPFEDYCRKYVRITNKAGEVVPFVFNEGQREFEARVQERFVSQNLPVRTITLKARQIGFSTQTQARLIRDLTLNGNRQGLVVAHEMDAAGNLFRMGQTMYARLPEELDAEPVPELKPPTGQFTRGKRLHFSPPERDAWIRGDAWPDSIYHVDTANEADAGRSFTYHYLHLSEAALWANFMDKMVGLMATVPDEPGTWVNIESTAKGANLFKDEWDSAVRGDSDYFPFFWPWWKEPSYRVELTEDERRNFKPGRGKHGEGEPELLDPGPVDYFTHEHVPLTLEQLAWRRLQLRKPGYSLDKFHQEYPATPDEAFTASGHQVFDQKRIAQILVKVDISDPVLPDENTPGPILGGFEAGAVEEVSPRPGVILEKPKESIWVPEKQIEGEPWRLWLPRDADGGPSLEPAPLPQNDRGSRIDQPKRRQFVGAVDASGGKMGEGHTDSDYMAVQFIDHRTREQVARYRSRETYDIIARKVYLAALWLCGHDLNMAPWIAVEITGGYGLPIARRLHNDYGYPFVYLRTRLDGRNDSEDDRLGWNTGPNTKPILIDGMTELLAAEDIEGLIRDRETAHEFQTFVRLTDKQGKATGKTGAEPGRYDDLLMALMIAHQVATEEALRPDWWGRGRAVDVPLLANYGV